MGIGGNLPIGKGWRIYCELGAGISLTSYTPERDWELLIYFQGLVLKSNYRLLKSFFEYIFL